MIKFKKELLEKAKEERKKTDPKVSNNQIAYAVLTSDISKDSKRRLFYSYLAKEEMPEDVLERVGEYLNVAPEFITGGTSAFPEIIFPYSFHLRQKLTLKQVMRDWMVFTGNGEIALTSEQWNDLYIGLREYTENYLKSIGK